MSRSITNLAGPLTGVEYINSALSAVDANIRTGATTLFSLYVDNSSNAAASYLQLFNNVNPTLGSTAPDMIIYVPLGIKLPVIINPNSAAPGLAFGTGLSMACTTTPTGSMAPSSSVTVTAVMS